MTRRRRIRKKTTVPGTPIEDGRSFCYIDDKEPADAGKFCEFPANYGRWRGKIGDGREENRTHSLAPPAAAEERGREHGSRRDGRGLGKNHHRVRRFCAPRGPPGPRAASACADRLEGAPEAVACDRTRPERKGSIGDIPVPGRPDRYLPAGRTRCENWRDLSWQKIRKRKS